MRRRTALRAALLVATLGPLGGCSAYGLYSAIQGLQGPPDSYAAADGSGLQRYWTLTGTIKVPSAITQATPFNQLAALSTSAPLGAVADVAGVSVWGATSLRTTQAAFRPGTIEGAPVACIDVETGSLVASGTTDKSGSYTLKLVVQGEHHPFVVQSVLKNALDQVVGYLAAPLEADLSTLEGRRTQLDLTPATTAVALSAVLLTESYARFDLRTGFQGFSSPRLAPVIAQIAPASLRSAANLFDQSRSLNGGSSFEQLLSDVATTSAVLTYQVRRLAMSAQGTQDPSKESLPLNAVILGQYLDQTAALTTPPPGSESKGLFAAIADQIDLASARAQADQLSAGLPTLPPLPTPTPAQGVEVRLE